MYCQRNSRNFSLDCDIFCMGISTIPVIMQSALQNSISVFCKVSDAKLIENSPIPKFRISSTSFGTFIIIDYLVEVEYWTWCCLQNSRKVIVYCPLLIDNVSSFIWIRMNQIKIFYMFHTLVQSKIFPILVRERKGLL